MSAQPKIRMTREEYLAFERASETKHEFWGGRVYSMAGASERHIIITGNTYASLHAQLRDRDCIVYPNDMRVRLGASDDYAYPDVTAVCGQRLFDDGELDTLLNPAVVIEVLSPSTEMYDRGKKFVFYRRLASLQEYMLVSQERVLVEQYVKRGDHWTYTTYELPDDVITLQSFGCTLLLKDMYAKIRFEPPLDDA